MLLVHYDDLEQRPRGAMRGLAARLEIEVDEAAWPELVGAASFSAMSARAESLLPDRNGILRDPAAFFRRGTSGAARRGADGVPSSPATRSAPAGSPRRTCLGGFTDCKQRVGAGGYHGARAGGPWRGSRRPHVGM